MLTLFVQLFVVCTAVWMASNLTAAERPNFVIIIADDMACEDCGAYGHPHIRTPNIDRLAAEGMRFDNAFLTCSSCSPSRASIMTGRYPHATGAPELHQPVPADQVLFSKLLKEAGYFTAALGKWHLGDAVKDQFDVVKVGGGDGAYAYWLPTLRERPKDRPFFFWLATTDPHRPYHDGTIPKPHTEDDVIVPPYLPDTPEVRRDLAMYYDEIGRLDANVGQVLAELERQGVADDTVVIFLSDNGRPFPRCKTWVTDSGIRTPLIVRWPGHVQPGSTCAGLVSSVDIAPTILELAGLQRSETFQGVSFAELLRNPQAKVREYVYAEHNWHDYKAYQRAVRSTYFMYIRNWVPEVPRTPPADAVRSPTFQEMRKLRDAGKLPPEQMQCFTVPAPEEELYDVAADPHSLVNLAGKPNYDPILVKMRHALDAWRRSTGDYVPETLTPDKFDRETGTPLQKKASE
ncbi:MAG: heparan N-sulfatase [Planctomycetota bacterium]|nr:MAG: heparan N-sulfatase [Planctomycetota bacterium]